MIISIKTGDQFYASYGEYWQNITFPMNPWDSGGHDYATVPVKLLGQDIEITDDEYEFFKRSGVIRYFDPRWGVMIFITPEMVLGYHDVRAKREAPTQTKPYNPVSEMKQDKVGFKNLYQIFLKEQIHLKSSSIVTLDDSVIREKINCYFD